MPTTSSADRLTMILTDLLGVFQKSHPAVPFLQQGTELNEAIRSLQSLLFLYQDQNATAPSVTHPGRRPRVPLPVETSVEPLLSPNKQKIRSQTARTHAFGTITTKKIGDGKTYEGEVTKYDPLNKFYSIAYKDGDKEEFTHEEVTTYRQKTQQYTRRRKVRSLVFATTSRSHRHKMSIPTKANPTPKRRVDHHHKPSSSPDSSKTSATSKAWMY